MEPQQLNISLDKTTEVCCKHCSGIIFTEGVILRKASKFLTGTPNDALVPISIMYCTMCGTPLEETVPTQLKELLPKQVPQPDENPEPTGGKVIQMFPKP